MKNRGKIKLISIIFLLGLIFLLWMSGDVKAADSEGNFVIVLDPGHGASDPGAIGGNIKEADVNFKLAYYAKEELEKYEGVKVYLTRYNDCPTIYDRVEIAKNYNADLLVSMHINSGASNTRGAAIWVTQDNTQVEYNKKASEAASIILNNISSLGIGNNGVQTRSGKADEWYDSGVVQDYYGIIRYAQRVKMRSLLVEHCFISNSQDREFINSDEKIRRLAQADVKGIADAYQLKRKGQGYIPVKSMTMDISELNLEMQEKDLQPVKYLNVVFNPINVSNDEVEWYSSNPDVVRIWGNRIRGLQEGVATIKAISKSNQRIAFCKVIVTKPKVALEKITVDKEEQVVNIDQTGDILVCFDPINCDDKEIYWKSSNPDVVRIWNGHFRGIKEGESVITAVTRAGGKQASCKVTVKDPNKINVEKIETDHEEYTINIGEAVDVGYTYKPSNATNAEFYWGTTNPEIIRVYGNRFRGLKEGTTELIVKTVDGKYEKKIKVTVKDPDKINVEKIETDHEEYTINIGEAVDVGYTYKPSNATNAEFYWGTTNPEIIRVYGNRFRGLKEGTTELVVKTVDGKYEKKIKVTVKDLDKINIEKIETDHEEYTINIGEAVDVGYTYKPSNATNAEFYWGTTNPEIIRVYGNRFRGLKEGTTELIVKTVDGKYEKKIKVTVKDPDKINVEKIETDHEEYTINIGEAVDVGYTYKPSNATNAEFYWGTTNPEIIRVYGNRFRGLKEGRTELIVKTVDGIYERRIKVIVGIANE